MKLERNKDIELTVINESCNPIIVIDVSNHRIIFFNKAAKDLFGKKMEVGIKCQELFFDRLTPCQECMIDKKNYGEKEIFHTNTGRYLSIFLKNIEWEGKDSVVVYINDVTLSRRCELSNNQLTAFFDNLPIGMGLFKYNVLGEIVPLKLSKAITELLGLKIENNMSINNQLDKINIHADDRRRLKREVTCAVKGDPYYLDGVYRFFNNKENRFKYLRITAIGERGSDSVINFYVSFIDVDKQYIAYDALRFAQKNIDIALGAADINYWEYYFLEDKAKSVKMHGGLTYLDHDMNDWPSCILDKEIVHPEDAEIYRNKFMELKTRISDTIEFNARIRNKEGNYVWRNIIANTVYNEGVYLNYAVCFSRNIDKERNELEALYKRERNQNVMLKELIVEKDKANDIKTEFLSRMSHDMRTPLGAIIGLANFGIDEFKDEMVQGYFTQIKNSAEYLLALMNDVLEMQKIESGNIELNLEVSKTGEVSNHVETIVKSRAEEKGISLILNKEKPNIDVDYYMIDKIRTQQVLINVLNNAIKYTPAGGIVTWDIKTHVLSDTEFEVINTVTDTGVGMSKEFQRVMFEPFSKENNPFSKSEGGTGLGLAISKNLVKAMGGDIKLESELGIGTTVKITLPHRIADKKEIAEYEENKSKVIKNTDSLKDKRILLCEDVSINVKIVTKILNNYGMIVEVAENGKEGVTLAAENKYDAILMDIKMPVMDGLTATKKIRRFDKETPIVALSANAYTEDIKKSIKAGMNTHLSKPIDSNELIKTLQENIRG